MDVNFIFRGKEIVDHFWEIFMKIEFEKINKRCMKLELSQVGMKNIITIISNHVVISCLVFIFGYQIVLLLRKMRWKVIIGHPKDQGNEYWNLRTNSH